MKKFLFGITAIVLAIGFSAFTTIKKKPEQSFTTYRYFKVNPGHRTQSTFLNSDVSYETSATSVPTNICVASDTYVCLVGFSTSQVSASPPYVLLDNSGADPQNPNSSAGERKRDNDTSPN